MSVSDRLEVVREAVAEFEEPLNRLYELYHIPVLAGLMAFMLWVRTRHYERFMAEDGTMTFIGNDAWYHYRTTGYVLENYPFNQPFDPWTSFDTGQHVGQFGTIFDQMIATVILVVGLGSPAQSTIDQVFFFAPAIFGVLCIVPVYLIGKRLGGRFGGIIAATILAVTPGIFLSRSMAGFVDHHVTEVLFQATALFAVMVMIAVAREDRPIYELIEAREFDALRRPVLWGVISGVAITLHMLNWQPAVFFVGLIGIFLLVYLTLEYLRGYSPDHVAIPTVVAMAIPTVVMLLYLQELSFGATDYSLTQVFVPFAVGATAVFMAGLARVWNARELSKRSYAGVIAALTVALPAIAALALPDVFGFFIDNLRQVAGFGATDTARTIGEAQAPRDPIAFFYNSYGLAFYTGMAGLALLAFRGLTAKRPRGEYLLVVIFSLFTLSATLTQQRFDYYLVIAIGALNAYLVGAVYNFVDLQAVRQNVLNVKPYQFLIVIAILFVIVGPVILTGGPVAAADQAANPGEYQQWEDSLEWLSEDTPEVGAYGTGDDPRLEYNGAYPVTDDFDYQEGEYGVLAWWDYGHWITVTGERIPVANPFQRHAEESADFLLADDEEESLEILEEDSGDGSGVQYVMVDRELGYAGTQKYTAPTAWEARHDVESGDLGVTVRDPQTAQPIYGIHSQRSYESMRVRLYQHHGSAVDPAPFVARFGVEDQFGFAVPPEGQLIEEFDTVEEAREAAEDDPNAIHGGLLGFPGERVEALEQFRLVHGSETTGPSPFNLATGQADEQESWVKTFERVEGATIEGENAVPENEVRAVVEMEIGATGETFEYVQYAQADEDGNFELRVPYSTTGYDEFGTEAGYTDVDVRATGDYRIEGGFDIDEEAGPIELTAEVEVSEAKVLGEDEESIEVDMEEFAEPLQQPEQEE
ncbi:MAG: oligosaccharyl transferase, archaeosortase A system-associated [Natronomonas sp.]